jgi:hypothetical protein
MSFPRAIELRGREQSSFACPRIAIAAKREVPWHTNTPASNFQPEQGRCVTGLDQTALRLVGTVLYTFALWWPPRTGDFPEQFDVFIGEDPASGDLAANAMLGRQHADRALCLIEEFSDICGGIKLHVSTSCPLFIAQTGYLGNQGKSGEMQTCLWLAIHWRSWRLIGDSVNEKSQPVRLAFFTEFFWLTHWAFTRCHLNPALAFSPSYPPVDETGC